MILFDVLKVQYCRATSLTTETQGSALTVKKCMRALQRPIPVIQHLKWGQRENQVNRAKSQMSFYE